MKMSKRKGVAILCVFMVIIAVVYYALVMNQADERLDSVELNNGDEISFNKGENYVTAVGTYDERYMIFSKKNFSRKFPGHEEDKVKINLPEQAVNLKHFYQLKGETGKPTEDYDEIYQWETEVYKDAQSEILFLIRNSGNQGVTADRGYVELSFYKEEPQRLQVKDGGDLEEISYIKSHINKKEARVTEIPTKFNSDRKCYLAEIFDIDGEGTNAFLTADNVSREYFIAVVERLAGRNYPMPETAGGSQDGKADSKESFAMAEKAIKYKEAAEEMLYTQHNDEIRAKDFVYNIYSEYVADTKEKDGKIYNIYAQVTIGDEKTKEFYMHIKKNRQGVFVEKGETLVETME
ncbi:Uncharacterised protein [uncultured Eubacterium sp.]|nr:Uncharacterised protein [uncultured Eubacterium sp.]